MLKKIISPAAGCGGGKLVIAFLFLSMLVLSRLTAHDLVAVTESGETVVIAEVEKDIEVLTLTLRNSGITMADPAVRIAGLAELSKLREITFYHVPQLDSFDFLSDCMSLERLIISFARVRSTRFLKGLQNLELLHLELCDDWETDSGLAFLNEPLDLLSNSSLEYLAFRVCDLKRVPVIVNIPKTLRILDISYNAIDIDDADTPALEALRHVERIYVNGNTVTEPILSAYGNIVLENSDDLLSRYLDD